MQLRQLLLRDLLCGPADNETFRVGCGGFGDDVEVDVVDDLGDERKRKWDDWLVRVLTRVWWCELDGGLGFGEEGVVWRCGAEEE